MRLLIVDDDRKAAQILARGLREERFVVDVASTAEQGDEMATATDYDLIVLDWLLPDQEGTALCREWRAPGPAPPPPLVTPPPPPPRRRPPPHPPPPHCLSP